MEVRVENSEENVISVPKYFYKKNFFDHVTYDTW